MVRCLLLLCVALLSSAHADDSDIYDFFAAEAQVVTASQRPVPLSLAPATVHVVTAQDLVVSGAQTLWDALRTLPGVDVLTVQTFQGEVGLRGLNKALNNRVLVLLDGKSVLSGYFDRVTWEYLPVGLEEIDRIEVVLGPSSALHGPNAVSGVINIITRDPDELAGVRSRVGLGEYSTQLGDVLVGGAGDRLAGHVGAGWRSTHRFENQDDPASQVGNVRGRLQYAPDREIEAVLRGGVTRVDSRQNLGGIGSMSEEGTIGYARADLRHGQSTVQTSWNRNRTSIDNADETDMPVRFDLDHDLLEVQAERTGEWGGEHALTAGTGVRYDRVESGPLRDGVHTQTLSSLYFEYQWVARPRVLLSMSGRTDRHSQAGWQHSPRASLVWSPREKEVVRLSAGSAFRFPTITESQMAFDQAVAPSQASTLPFDEIVLRITSNRRLDAERMRMIEAAYSGHYGAVAVSLAGWVYRLQDVIATTRPVLRFDEQPPSISVSFENRDDDIVGWGGELDLGADLSANWRGRANFAYQNIDADADPLVATDGGPPHKINLGLERVGGPWRGSLWLHRVASTRWFANALSLSRRNTARVDAYSLLNAHVERDLSDGFVVGLSALNLLDDEHFEILPVLRDQSLGQSGKVVRRRVVATLSWRR